MNNAIQSTFSKHQLRLSKINPTCIAHHFQYLERLDFVPNVGLVGRSLKSAIHLNPQLRVFGILGQPNDSRTCGRGME